MSPFIAEVLGTFLLILLGNGVVANCLLKDTKGNGGGLIVITAAWAFAVYVGVVVAGPYSGAHLNPAVTIGLAIAGKFAVSQVVPYIVAQFLGAMLGALAVYQFYKDHFKITPDAGLRSACFCTAPAIRNLANNFFSEVLGTFVLMLTIFYIVGNATATLPTGQEVPVGLGSLGGLPVALLVFVIGMSLGGTTGYAINPCRDLGPRLVLTLLKGLKGNPDWGYALVPGLGPIVGSAAAALLYLALS